jgi:diguanylate cyclase (GGDEF)-like protein
MLEFNVAGTLIYNIGIDIFSVIIMIMLYYSSRKGFSYTQDMIIFCRIQIMIIVIILADIVMWLANGRPGRAAFYIEYADNMIYFFCQILVVMDWIRYVIYRVYGKKIPEKMELMVLIIPSVILMVLIVTTPATKWCFYIDSANYYHRGILCTSLAVITIMYIIAASVIGLVRRSREKLGEKKREYLIISAFALPPLIGGTAQVITYGLSILWPTVVLSILMAFINMQNQAISQDALTGLNNRGNLDKYLHSLIDGSEGRVGLIMADINNFKKINDSFGHDTGDDILIYVAGILKNTLAGTSAFLARYGGDEFVIVMPEGSEKDIEVLMNKVRTGIEVFNATINYGFVLSLGMGYAVYPSAEVGDVNSLLRAADKNMYINKKLMKSEAGWEVRK